jgi:7-keto-8-aminopelargonate synthetase-like enzyme
MQMVKTDISMQDALYEQASRLAGEMQISQEELFNLAIADYLRRSQNQKLLQSVNEAYEDGLDDSELAMLDGIRRHQRHLERLEEEDL